MNRIHILQNPMQNKLGPRSTLLFAISILVATAFGCSNPAPPPRPRLFASAEEVELNFGGRTFILGDNDRIAEVRQPGWPKDHFLRLPFWLGINVLIPGVTQPKEGDYYVISEAALEKPLGAPDQWVIEAGSTLVKQEAVFVTTHTHYVTPGKILPTIVQFVGMRSFPRADGKNVAIAELHELSLPMKWTLGGNIPPDYARYQL